MCGFDVSSSVPPLEVSTSLLLIMADEFAQSATRMRMAVDRHNALLRDEPAPRLSGPRSGPPPLDLALQAESRAQELAGRLWRDNR